MSSSRHIRHFLVGRWIDADATYPISSREQQHNAIQSKSTCLPGPLLCLSPVGVPRTSTQPAPPQGEASLRVAASQPRQVQLHPLPSPRPHHAAGAGAAVVVVVVAVVVVAHALRAMLEPSPAAAPTIEVVVAVAVAVVVAVAVAARTSHAPTAPSSPAVIKMAAWACLLAAGGAVSVAFPTRSG